jgi:hypothetical protein
MGGVNYLRSKSMPLARIDLIKGKSTEYRQTVGDVVYTAMVEILKAPKDDRFQVIAEHDESNLIYDANFFGISRSKDVIFVQLTLAEGRTLEQKRGFISAWWMICTIASASEGRMFSSASLELRARTGPLETARCRSCPRSPRPPGSARSRKPSYLRSRSATDPRYAS